MPLYEYQCDACGGRFEIIQKFSDAPAGKCSLCGAEGQVRKLISSPAFQFKGSGWYITDYARKGGDKAPGKDGKSDSSADAGKASAKDDGAKSEAAPKTDAAPASTASKDTKS